MKTRSAVPWVLALLVLGLSPGEPPRAAGGDPAAPDAPSPAVRMDAAAEAGRYDEALAAALELHAREGADTPETCYRIAGLHALLGRSEAAYEWLDRAIDAGFDGSLRLYNDPAFASLKSEPRFRTTFERIWIPQYLAMLERPERDGYQMPDEIMAALALSPGERVADIGAGSGYFTLRVARAVGPEGRVLALDIRQQMLDHIAARLADEGVVNVTLNKVEPDDPGLAPGSVDTILMVDTIHYVKDRAAYAARLREGLAPGGRVVIIDFTPKPWEERPWGPRPEQQVALETLDAEMAAGGLRRARSHDFLPEQYFVEYVPADVQEP
jgi:SAM-dependent methyltransferase